ncbi:MAG: hypothetical protein GC134_06830 [Proteobacteria bacterium]|nr:hypothetical protein [Pseudomonadota bacterium]
MADTLWRGLKSLPVLLFFAVWALLTPAQAQTLQMTGPIPTSRIQQWDDVLHRYDPAGAAALSWRLQLREVATRSQSMRDHERVLALQLRLHAMESPRYVWPEYPAPKGWLTPAEFATTRGPIRDVDFAIAAYFGLKEMGFDDVALMSGWRTTATGKTGFIVTRVRTSAGYSYLERGQKVLLLELPANYQPRLVLTTENIRIVRRPPQTNE